MPPFGPTFKPVKRVEKPKEDEKPAEPSKSIRIANIFVNTANYLPIAIGGPKTTRTVNYIYFRPDMAGEPAFQSNGSDDSYPWTGRYVTRGISGQLNIPACKFDQLVAGTRRKLPEAMKIHRILGATSPIPTTAGESAKNIEYIALEDDDDVRSWVISATSHMQSKENLNCLVILHRPANTDGTYNNSPPPFLTNAWLNH